MRKIYTWALVALIAIGSIGCKTLPGPQPDKAELVAAVTQVAVKNLTLPLLNKNPDLVVALEGLATSIDVVFDAGTLDAAKLKEFTDTLGTRYGLSDSEQVLVAGAIWDVWNLYAAYYGETVANTTDPRVKRILTAFRDGIRQGIDFYRAFTPSADQLRSVGARIE